MDSIEHLEVYINIIRSYLKEKGREAGKPITDFTNFEIFLSHDKAHYLKWGYSQEKPNISNDSRMIKFYHQPIYIATNGLIRVLVAYQKNIDSNRATEIGSVVKPTSTLYTINSNQLV